MIALVLALFTALPAEAAPQSPSADKLVVVATHSALASIAKQVGGDRIEVTTIADPTWDLHSIQAKPSVFAQLTNADVFIHTGLDLELWADPAIKGSHNPKIVRYQPGNIDASDGIKLLQVPDYPSRAEGDVHLYGNPHYWTDPVNGLTIANNIAAGFTAVDPGSAKLYLANLKTFQDDLRARLRTWLKKAIAKKGTPIVVYHDSWPYFARRFGFEVVGTVEPKPRIPPTQKHLLEVIETIRSRKVAVIVREPYHDQDATRFLEDQTGVKVVTMGTMPGFRPGTETYQDLIEQNLYTILGALP
ncbi:MAG: metal ABC transporter substrate-binding protein [Planctomycetota bacterium]